MAAITPFSQKWWLLRDLNSQAQRATHFKCVVYSDSTKEPLTSVFPESQIDYLTIIEMVGVGRVELPTSTL